LRSLARAGKPIWLVCTGKDTISQAGKLQSEAGFRGLLICEIPRRDARQEQSINLSWRLIAKEFLQ